MERCAVDGVEQTGQGLPHATKVGRKNGIPRKETHELVGRLATAHRKTVHPCL